MPCTATANQKEDGRFESPVHTLLVFLTAGLPAARIEEDDSHLRRNSAARVPDARSAICREFSAEAYCIILEGNRQSTKAAL